jgi:hypothetical protein
VARREVGPERLGGPSRVPGFGAILRGRRTLLGARRAPVLLRVAGRHVGGCGRHRSGLLLHGHLRILHGPGVDLMNQIRPELTDKNLINVKYRCFNVWLFGVIEYNFLRVAFCLQIWENQ